MKLLIIPVNIQYCLRCTCCKYACSTTGNTVFISIDLTRALAFEASSMAHCI